MTFRGFEGQLSFPRQAYTADRSSFMVSRDRRKHRSLVRSAGGVPRSRNDAGYPRLARSKRHTATPLPRIAHIIVQSPYGGLPLQSAWGLLRPWVRDRLHNIQIDREARTFGPGPYPVGLATGVEIRARQGQTNFGSCAGGGSAAAEDGGFQGQHREMNLPLCFLSPFIQKVRSLRRNARGPCPTGGGACRNRSLRSRASSTPRWPVPARPRLRHSCGIGEHPAPWHRW